MLILLTFKEKEIKGEGFMFGNNIREIRKSKGLTLEQLSSQIGITPSGLSQIERDLVDPSLSLLKKLASALGLSLHSLFTEESSNYVSRSVDRKKVFFCDNSLIYEFLTPRPSQTDISPKMEVNKVTLKSKTYGSENYTSHNADECFLVLEGVYDILIENEDPITLYAGDCIYHTSGVSHKIYNPSNTDSIAISVLSDIVY